MVASDEGASMFLLHFSSCAMRKFHMLQIKSCFFTSSRKYERLLLWSALMMVGALLAGCTGLNLGGNAASNGQPLSTGPTTTLTGLHWCSKPLMVFRDEGASAANSAAQPTATATTTPVTAVPATPTSTPQPRTITSWSQVEPALGFTVYLPETLPQGTCLVSASGTLHDPIFGSSFTIGYLLPDHSALSLSEAPLRSQNPHFQCSPASSVNVGGSGARGTPTPTHGSASKPLQLCSGALKRTSIVFSAHGTTTTLEQLFHSLQPNVNWIPAAS
jgi:hypothetical protein